MSLRRAMLNLSRTGIRLAQARSSSVSTVRTFAALSSVRPNASSRPAALPQQQQQKRWASGGGLSKEDIERRVLEVIQTFEKADPGKITPTASFAGDLGLDSLDAVEVVLAIEEEFSIEIPDEEADKITTVGEAISYIARTPTAV